MSFLDLGLCRIRGGLGNNKKRSFIKSSLSGAGHQDSIVGEEQLWFIAWSEDSIQGVLSMMEGKNSSVLTDDETADRFSNRVWISAV